MDRNQQVTLVLSTGDWEFIASGLKDLISQAETSKSDPEMLNQFSDWIRSCDDCIIHNRAMLQQIEAVLGYSV